jgi:hypothetical protein
MTTASASRYAVTTADRVKIALAICVAGQIFDEAAKRPASEAKALRVKIAADALDKTRPDPYIMARHHTKPPEQSDAQFLLQYLDEISLVDPADWPRRKVSPQQWGEYTRAMRGLETFLKKAYTGAKLSTAEQADVLGTLRFVAPQVQYIQDEVVKSLLVDFVDFPA